MVNYFNDYVYMCVIEFKYLIGQCYDVIVLVYEYLQVDGDFYYFVLCVENIVLYCCYEVEVEQLLDVSFIGWLVIYKYYNMDQVVVQVLVMFKCMQVGGVVVC